MEFVFSSDRGVCCLSCGGCRGVSVLGVVLICVGVNVGCLTLGISVSSTSVAEVGELLIAVRGIGVVCFGVIRAGARMAVCACGVFGCLW